MTEPRASGRADLDRLLDEAIRVAQHLLRERGEFYPFALALAPDGTSKLLAGSTESDRPSTSEIIDILVAGMRATRDELQASAISFDARIRLGGGATDAIAVALEHRDGDAVRVFLPYQRRPAGEPRYAELVAEPGQRRIFVEEVGATEAG